VNLKSIFRAVSSNSNHILTGLSVAGVVGTTFLAVKATPDALRAIDHLYTEVAVSEDPDRDISRVEIVKTAWKHYIPAATCGVATITCIIGANTISTKRQTALVAGYAVAEQGFREYRDKVVETIGAKKDEEIRASIAQDFVDKNPPSHQILIKQNGSSLCLDKESGQYFMSDMETIRKAENDVNAEILNGDGYASVNDFYARIGVGSTNYGEQYGFTLDNRLELKFASVLTENDVPAIVIEFVKSPVADYYKINPWR
jgi:hypothetical protein